MKLKKLSDEFVISVGMLLISFFIFQAAILPGIEKDNQAALVSSSLKNEYTLTPSKLRPGSYDSKYKIDLTVKPGKNASFDVAIEPFNDAKALKEIGLKTGDVDFGKIRDAWNYPVQDNIFMKTSRAGGDRSDDDPNTLGLVNCRENTSVTGYFKAYFEDVALDNNIGYDDVNFGQGRREEACLVLQDIASLIKLDETTTTPDILFSDSNDFSSPGALASASAYFGFYQSTPDNGSLHKHIISHFDPTPSVGEFDAVVNTGFNGISWDVDSELGPTTYDFYTVIYHEVMHALGFRGLLPAVITTTGEAYQHDTFDYFSYGDEALSQEFINHSDQTLGAPIGAPSPWFITNLAVYRGKKNVVSASPDGIRPLYSPITWQQGSSLSHFDMDRANGQVYVMNPTIGMNTERVIHEDEKEVLCHLGYQVEGMTGCEGATPFANGDLFVMSNSLTMCLDPRPNDNSFSGGLLTLNSFNPIISLGGDTFSFYPGSDCTGNPSSSPVGAKSIRFTRLNTQTSSRILAYSIRDSATNRISNVAPISISQCVGEEGEYVCNGDFELPLLTDNNGMQAFSCPVWNPGNIVPFWCKIIGSADLVKQDSSNPLYDLPITCGSPYLLVFPGCSIDTPDGSTQMAFLVQQQFPARNEGLLTGLKIPLTEGDTYRLSYDFRALVPDSQSQVLSSNADSITSISLVSGLYNGPHLYSSNSLGAIEPFGQMINTSQLEYNLPNPGWTHVDQMFTATGDYDFFSIYGKFEGTGTQNILMYLDNISIKPVEPGVGGEISGTVYQDTNLSGQKDTNESGLPSVEVGLFETGNSTPLQTITTEDIPNIGKYSFTVPDGNYFTALIGESIFTNITEPSNNNILPGYLHAQETNIVGGADNSLNNFGVVLDDNGPDQVNIRVKKALIDSSLSVFDRNITWRVEATNFGPDVANNIDIKDFPPVPLVYYTHVVSLPNTYNPSTGYWHISHLAPGETAYINIVTKVPLRACGIKKNIATLVSLDEIDTDPSDDESSAIIKLKNCNNQIDPIDK